jgi:ParB-like chromosome segregation protein Spo0J
VARWKGSFELSSNLRRVDELVEDAQNAREHDDRSIDSIALSLERFGQRKPIVIRENVVIAGNGTLRAARRLGWDEIAVAYADDLSESEARAYALADNRTAELSSWGNKLAEVYSGLPFEMREFTGFNSKDIQRAVEKAKAKAAGVRVAVITLTEDQAVIVKGALEKIRSIERDPHISDGKALELMAADWLSGADY